MFTTWPRPDGLFKTPAGTCRARQGSRSVTETHRAGAAREMKCLSWCLSISYVGLLELPPLSRYSNLRRKSVEAGSGYRRGGVGSGNEKGRLRLTFPHLALNSKSTVESHRIAIDCWQHTRDRMRTFSALMLTSGWLEWLARLAEDRRGGSVVVSIMEACESSIGICPEYVHAPAHL